MSPLVPLAVLLAMSILLGTHLVLSPLWVASFGIVAGSAGIIARRRPIIGMACGVIVWGCVAWLRVWQVTEIPAHHVARLIGAQPAIVRVHGVVLDDPIESFAPHEREQQVCVIRVTALKSSEHWQPATGLVRLRLDATPILLSYGDDIVAEGRARPVAPPGNPGQYDWRAALARQQIYTVMTVRPYQGVARLGPFRGQWWVRLIYAWRHRLEAAIAAAFDADHAGLMRALVLGQRVSLEESLKRAFVETGTMHLVVVSGFNVGLIAGILELFLRLLGLPFRARLILSGVCLGGYCLLTGMQPPVMRATLMAWTVLGAWWIDRAINWPNILAAAAIAILLLNPLQLWDAGFQLSFGAVASLLLFAKPVGAWLEPVCPALPSRLRRYVAMGLASTVAVWIGLWPVLAWYFQVVSPVSMLANLLLVPLVSLIVGAGTIAVSAGSAWHAVLGASAGGLRFLLDTMAWLVRVCQRVPGGWWLIARPAWWVMAGYYCLLMLTCMRVRLRWSPARVVIAWLIGLTLWVWADVAAIWQEARWVQIAILDVGHGDSIVLRTPSHHTILVDAGSADAGRYAVVPFLRARGWSTIDALCLTHPDEDHLGGVPAILDELRVRQVFTNGFPPDTPTAQHVMAALEARHIPRATLSAGMQLTGLPGLEMIVLHPPAGFVPETDPASNDNSLVLQMRAGTFRVLLTGDLEERGIPAVLRWGDQLRSTVLKVPHHGSALGPGGAALFEQIHPTLAVISVGQRRGLPSPQTLEALRQVGAKIVMTRDAGAVIIRTDWRAHKDAGDSQKRSRVVTMR